VALLDACLVNGYNSKTITITRSGSTATATCTTHGFNNKQTILISGANETDYNGTFRITNVTTNTFDYTVTGSPATPATGTITAKVNPSGWTKPYTGTNKAAFRPGAGAQHYYRFDDTGTTQTRFLGYETMSDVDTGTNGFPTNAQVTGGMYIQKSNSADAVIRPWYVLATSKRAYVFTDYLEATSVLTPYVYFAGYGFGDFDSRVPADAYNSFTSGGTSSANNSGSLFLQNGSGIFTQQVANFYIARNYASAAGAVNVGRICPGSIYSTTGQANDSFPAFGTNGFIMGRNYITEPAPSSKGWIRGETPGYYTHYHRYTSMPSETYFTGTGVYAGKEFMFLHLYNANSWASIVLEVSDTWGP